MSQEPLPVADLAQSSVRHFVGKPVHLALVGGRVVEGHLVSFDGRSLWVVADGEDRFVPVAQVDAITDSVVLAG